MLLLVEGPHDLEFCARLLKPRGFVRIQQHDALKTDHPFWQPLVPEKWPQRGDMLARHPVPVFFSNQLGQSVAIINAIGLPKLATRLGIDLAILSTLPEAVGIVLDADDVGAPQTRHTALVNAIAARPETEARQIPFPAQPGVVAQGQPRCGVFIMPDNHSSGTLEALLLEAGESAYPLLLQAAITYVQGASSLNELNDEELVEYRKPAGPRKAITAAMASILKPGKSIQVSIQDNRWLSEAALNLPRIAAVRGFLDSLLD
jgi:hypothetical protein